MLKTHIELASYYDKRYITDIYPLDPARLGAHREPATRCVGESTDPGYSGYPAMDKNLQLKNVDLHPTSTVGIDLGTLR